MTPAPADSLAPHCSLCRDELAHATVVAIEGSDALVRSDDGCHARVAIDFIPGARAGDRLLVRLGVALAREQPDQEPREDHP